jgi:hypothetical protein
MTIRYTLTIIFLSLLPFMTGGCEKIDYKWHRYKDDNCEVWGRQRANVEVISHGWKVIENADVKEGNYGWGWEVTLKIKEPKDGKQYLLGIKEIEYALFDNDKFKLTSITSKLDDHGRMILNSGEEGPVLQEAGVTETYRQTGETTNTIIQRASVGRCRIILD